jgi:hypothetical protein
MTFRTELFLSIQEKIIIKISISKSKDRIISIRKNKRKSNKPVSLMGITKLRLLLLTDLSIPNRRKRG